MVFSYLQRVYIIVHIYSSLHSLMNLQLSGTSDSKSHHNYIFYLLNAVSILLFLLQNVTMTGEKIMNPRNKQCEGISRSSA